MLLATVLKQSCLGQYDDAKCKVRGTDASLFYKHAIWTLNRNSAKTRSLLLYDACCSYIHPTLI